MHHPDMHATCVDRWLGSLSWLDLLWIMLLQKGARSEAIDFGTVDDLVCLEQHGFRNKEKFIGKMTSKTMLICGVDQASAKNLASLY
jgi:hypothetical protein